MYRHWKFASIPVVLGLELAACPGPEEQAPGTLELVTGSTSVVAFTPRPRHLFVV